MHRLHVFVAGLYVFPLSSIFQSMEYVEPLWLMFQMWVLRVVSVLYFSFLNDFRCPYLFLKGGADSSTYISTVFMFSLLVSVTVAWYIKFSDRHLASRGQGLFFGQPQDLGCGLSEVCNSIFIVSTYDLFNVWCCSVTDLNSISI